MHVEKDIKVNHDIEIVMIIFSDPSFLIPKVFPGVISFKAPDQESFMIEGKFLGISYKAKGRVLKGVDETRFIYDSDKGNGILVVKKIDDHSIKIILDQDNSLYGFLGRNVLSSNLNNLSKNVDEIIRLERIKRKI